MPLTDKGRSLLEEFQQEYGPEKGREVFYAAANKGTITGVHDKSKGKSSGNGKSKSSRKSRTKDKGS